MSSRIDPPGSRKGSDHHDEQSKLLDSSHKNLSHGTIKQPEQNHIQVSSISNDVEAESAQTDSKRSRPWGTLSILLLGVFIAQLDSSIVLATYGHIASEFHELESGSWLVSSYIIAQCAVQPLYGKLSDIYSRRSCLLTAYVLFTIGTLGIGQARSLWEIIAWRAVQGAGGAGMVSVVSIIVTDIVPKHEVAVILSYVNVMQTMGRSCGGVVGGLLTQSVGWRWAFLVQAPPMLIAIVLVLCALKLPSPNSGESKWSKLKRVDFVGAFFLTVTILAICLIIDLGGQRMKWTSPWMIGILVSGFVTGIAFVITAKIVTEPIFPLHLLTHWVVVSNYAVTLLGVVAQISLMTAVPLYFQATANVSTAVAGLYLVPAFVGNTLGGLLTGYWIRRTGRYKVSTVLGPIFALGCMALVLTWNGYTSPIESIASLPGGFAMGVISSSTFVGLIAGLDEQYIAIAASGIYLAFNVGGVVGVSAGNAVSQRAIRSSLEQDLYQYENKQKIIEQAISDLGFIWRLDNAELRAILIAAYTQGLHAVNYLGIASSVVGLLFAVTSRGTRLEKK